MDSTPTSSGESFCAEPSIVDSIMVVKSESPKFDKQKIEQAVRLMLEGMGEDITREGLVQTPARIARMYEELVCGTNLDAGQEITCKFVEHADDLVLIRDIPFASICEHHLVPFMGHAHVGYIPKNGIITGLSKLSRVVELASKRLQVQERMTAEIADALMKRLDPQGAIVVVEAEHLCMSIRGVKKPGTRTVTSAVRGIVATDNFRRAELMSLINRG